MMPRSAVGCVLVAASLLAGLPPAAAAAEPGLPFVPTMFGDSRTSLPDGTPSSRGADKIAENDSPWPADRLYVNWNCYHDVHSSWSHINRESLGIEKTILDGRASLGARLPFFQVSFEPGATNAFPGTEPSAVGDLILLGKYALVHQPEAVLSTGLVLSLPTGPNPDIIVNGQRVHSTTVQPFVGYGKVWDRLYLHGFSSIMVPTDSRDVTILFNDLGLGYWVRLGDTRFVTAIVPTVEVHANVPLTHRDSFVDSVVLIAGVNIVFKDRATLGLAIGPNVSQPRLFDFETHVSPSWRW